MFRQLLITIILIAACTHVHAQLKITYNEQEINYAAANIKYAFSATNDFSDNALQNIQKKGWQQLERKKLPISRNANCFWLNIPFNSFIQYGNIHFVNINNPHINFLQCWIIKDDSIVQSFKLTGDNIPFATRPLPTTSFVYPVNSNTYKDCSIVFAIDKRFTKLELPISFCSEAFYMNESQSKKLFIGIFTGVLLFLLLINTYLFIAVKEKLYLWYSTYLLMMVLYVPIDNGLLFKYIYPNFPEINDLIRPGLFIFSLVPLLNFFNELLSIEKLMPKLYSFNKRIIIGFVLLFIVAMLTSASNNYKLQGMWLKVAGILSPSLLLITVIEAVYFFIKKMRFSEFALASFGGIFFFIIILVLQQNEIIVQNNFTSNANLFGLFYEICIMLFALTWRYKRYKEDSERLLKENIQQQEKIFKETASWQEKEMQRMSSLLHDTVGANLGFLRLETDNMQLTAEGRNKIAEHITRIGNEVRNMSHSFSPIVLQDKGLYSAIEDMVKTIRNNSLINVQFEWIGKDNKVGLQYEVIIYQIVQELMQNMMKHSNAMNAFLQILVEQNIISIYIEDDGVGINTNQPSNGIGLKSIAKLVALLKGNYRIESEKGEGFCISIEFNQPTNEKI